MYMYQRVLSLTDRQIEIILFFSGRSNYISQSDNCINIFKCALMYVGSTNTHTHTHTHSVTLSSAISSISRNGILTFLARPSFISAGTRFGDNSRNRWNILKEHQLKSHSTAQTEHLKHKYHLY